MQKCQKRGCCGPIVVHYNYRTIGAPCGADEKYTLASSQSSGTKTVQELPYPPGPDASHLAEAHRHLDGRCAGQVGVKRGLIGNIGWVGETFMESDIFCFFIYLKICFFLVKVPC